MAIIDPNQNYQEQEQDQGQQNVQLTQGGPGIQTPSSPSQVMQPQRKGSGRFTNIQKYIQANQPAGEQLQSQIRKGIQTQAEGVRQGVQSRQQQFQQQLSPTQQFYSQQAGNLVNQAFQDPNQFTQNQEALNQFQQLRTGQTGNLGQLDLSQERSGAQKAMELAQQTGSEAGRFGLLRQAYNVPSYSTGQTRLDQLFLQANPNLRNLQQESQAIVNPLLNQISQAEAGAGQDISSIQNQAATLQQQIQGQLFGQGDDLGLIRQFEEKEKGEYEQMMRDKEKTLDRYRNLLSFKGMKNPYVDENGEPVMRTMQYKEGDQLGDWKNPYAQGNLYNEISQEDADALKAIGLDVSNPLTLYGVDPSEFLQAYTADKMPSLASTIRPEDYQRYQALNKLAGEQATPFLDTTGERELGSFSSGLPIEFMKKDFEQRLADAKKANVYATTRSAGDGGQWRALDYNMPVEQAMNFIKSMQENPAAFTQNDYYTDLYGKMKEALIPYMKQFKVKGQAAPTNLLDESRDPEIYKRYVRDYLASGGNPNFNIGWNAANSAPWGQPYTPPPQVPDFSNITIPMPSFGGRF